MVAATMKLHLTIVTVTILVLCHLVVSTKITLLHNNDFHSRFAPIDVNGALCDTESKNMTCFGGVKRTINLVEEKIKEKGPDNVLFLSAGDFYQGSLWYTFFKYEVVVDFVLNMHYDAICLGNHEFDNGVEGLEPFIAATVAGRLPFLAANINITREPRLKEIQPSVVVTKNGTKIGIIGYITPETATLAKPGLTVEFFDEIPFIQREVTKLKAQGVNILIALGHSGYQKDIDIAKAIPDLDIVVGGHTNTFLWNESDGDVPSTELSLGPYPTIEGKTLVVQANAYGKYLGHLDLEFDDNGDLISHSGKPILVDASIPEIVRDPQINVYFKKWSDAADEKGNSLLGNSSIFLEGRETDCRMRECILGNIMVDAYVTFFMEEINLNPNTGISSGWAEYPIAFNGGGNIRTSIDPRLGSKNGVIDYIDVLSIFPFESQAVGLTINGSTLKQVMEHSVSTYDPEMKRLEGRFLQVSGLKVVYDMTKSVGNRVSDLWARCGNDCVVPQYFKVEDNKLYKVITSDYNADGGDGYQMLRDSTLNRTNFVISDIEIITNYFKTHSPIFQELGNRINLLGVDRMNEITSGSRSHTVSIVSIVTLICSIMHTLLL